MPSRSRFQPAAATASATTALPAPVAAGPTPAPRPAAGGCPRSCQPVSDARVCASRSRRAHQLAAVRLGRLARRRAGPGVAQDVAALEVAAVAGLLEDEVLGEVRLVVAHVQPGDEDVLRLRRDAHRRRRPRRAGVVQPEHAELAQLVGDSGSAAHGSHQPMSQAYSRNTARMFSRSHVLRRTSPGRSRANSGPSRRSGISTSVGSFTVR